MRKEFKLFCQVFVIQDSDDKWWYLFRERFRRKSKWFRFTYRYTLTLICMYFIYQSSGFYIYTRGPKLCWSSEPVSFCSRISLSSNWAPLTYKMFVCLAETLHFLQYGKSENTQLLFIWNFETLSLYWTENVSAWSFKVTKY